MEDIQCEFCERIYEERQEGGYCYKCHCLRLQMEGEWVYSVKPSEVEYLAKDFIIKIHPLELYQEMINDKPLQSCNLNCNTFEMHQERSDIIEEIKRLGKVFMLKAISVSAAIKYLDIILYKITMIKQGVVCISKSKVLELSNSRVAIFKKSDALFMKTDSEPRLRSLINTSLELIALTCLLIATKVHEIDCTCLRIYELEKESKYMYTYKNITKCEGRILEEINWNTYIQTPLDYTNLYLTAGVLFTNDKYLSGGEEFYFSKTNNDADQERKISEIYESIIKLCYNDFYNHDYELLQYEDRLVGIATICAARKVSKVVPIISENFCSMYGFTMEEIEECLETLNSCVVKIPLLKKNSSFEDLTEQKRDTRHKEVEIVVQELPDEMSYRYSKLYPKEIRKSQVKSPITIDDEEKDCFQDYVEGGHKPKNFAEIICQDTADEVEEMPFSKPLLKERSSSVSCRPSEVNKIQLNNVEISGQNENTETTKNHNKTFKPKVSKKLKQRVSPRQKKPEKSKITKKNNNSKVESQPALKYKMRLKNAKNSSKVEEIKSLNNIKKTNSALEGMKRLAKSEKYPIHLKPGGNTKSRTVTQNAVRSVSHRKQPSAMKLKDMLKASKNRSNKVKSYKNPKDYQKSKDSQNKLQRSKSFDSPTQNLKEESKGSKIKEKHPYDILGKPEPRPGVSLKHIRKDIQKKGENNKLKGNIKVSSLAGTRNNRVISKGDGKRVIKPIDKSLKKGEQNRSNAKKKSMYYAMKKKSDTKELLNTSDHFLNMHKSFDIKPKSFTAKKSSEIKLRTKEDHDEETEADMLEEDTVNAIYQTNSKVVMQFGMGKIAQSQRPSDIGTLKKHRCN
ncbi:unnamed protein product [Moneuplotes crassus]|uniref:Cyclin N-terminal domain-containing protein n=1 Tax=Euplotes crassus TaxID=5936 RepID=A0AAD1XJC5_EUPCR|nr:unnamed protein product [Moneuplotes crassus]